MRVECVLNACRGRRKRLTALIELIRFNFKLVSLTSRTGATHSVQSSQAPVLSGSVCVFTVRYALRRPLTDVGSSFRCPSRCLPLLASHPRSRALADDGLHPADPTLAIRAQRVPNLTKGSYSRIPTPHPHLTFTTASIRSLSPSRTNTCLDPEL
jgi:hypothetical protein